MYVLQSIESKCDSFVNTPSIYGDLSCVGHNYKIAYTFGTLYFFNVYYSYYPPTLTLLAYSPSAAENKWNAVTINGRRKLEIHVPTLQQRIRIGENTQKTCNRSLR